MGQEGQGSVALWLSLTECPVVIISALKLVACSGTLQWHSMKLSRAEGEMERHFCSDKHKPKWMSLTIPYRQWGFGEAGARFHSLHFLCLCQAPPQAQERLSKSPCADQNCSDIASCVPRVDGLQVQLHTQLSSLSLCDSEPLLAILKLTQGLTVCLANSLPSMCMI